MGSIRDIIKTVPIKNRIVDAPVSIVFDSERVTWAPGETKYLPEPYADWFRAKSLYQLDSVTYQHKYKLVILGKGQDETEMFAEELPGRADGIIDWQNRGYTDPKTGKPFRRVEVPTTGVPVMEPRRDAADAELAAKQAQHAAMVDAAADKMAGFSEEEIAAGLTELSTRDDGRRATVRG